MKKSLRIGTVSGIGIFLHWTFLVLVAGLFAFYAWQSSSIGAALAGIGLILAIFGCVVLHELGHALTARRFDVGTRSITLYPIGGLAQLERLPSDPMREFWIAIAGPAVNVVLMAVFAALATVFGQSVSMSTLQDPHGNLFGTLVWMNAALAGFNLLPAFPMDGGRVLRALLALRKPYAEATEIAANVGQVMAILFGLYGLISANFILVFIALFVWVGAQQESRQATYRSLTENHTVRDAMMTRFAVLRDDDTLGDAVDELLAGTDHDFPVIDAHDRLVGILRRAPLIQALSSQGRTTPVAQVADAPDSVTRADTPLHEAFEQMNVAGRSTMPVLDDRGALVGLLTLENIGEMMMVEQATDQERRRTS